LDRYFSGPLGASSSRKVGGAAGKVSEDEKENEENGEIGVEVDIGQRIRAIRRTLDARNYGTMSSVPQGTRSDRPEVENMTIRDEVVNGHAASHGEARGARAQNLRRVGEVLGRWDAFVSHSFRSALCSSFFVCSFWGFGFSFAFRFRSPSSSTA
jgi:hypothetical protein